MEQNVKNKKELMVAEQKERYFAELFKRCMQLMDASYRQTHKIQVSN